MRVRAQRGTRGEADLGGDPAHRQVAGLRQVPGADHPLPDRPAAGAEPGLVGEAAGEGAQARPACPARSARVSGSSSRSLAQKAAVAGTFPPVDAAKAHASGDTGRTTGKLVPPVD